MNSEKNWEEHLKTSNPQKINELGTALGYPRCCIQEFIADQKRIHSGAKPKRSDFQKMRAANFPGNVFSGFIPCAKHAKLIISGKMILPDLIQDRKVEFVAFPFWELKTN